MIPVSEPWFLEEDAERVADCVRKAWVSSAGKSVDEFEAAWAGYCGRRYGVAMSSGMAALQSAIQALHLAPGDEVIMPAFTIVSCALAVVYQGGVPVLVDSDPRTWCIDIAQIESRITPRTRAIMPVHIYGHPVDMDPLLDLAARHGLAVVEDAAEAHGAEYRTHGQWRRCGSFGNMSCFSFYANKLIATGEGGMVVLDDADFAARLRSIRDLCFGAGRRFEHAALGHNFRLTNLQAALALPQIGRIDELLRRKRWMARLYRQLLADIPGIEQPMEMPWARSIFWMYGIVLGERWNFDAAELAARLRAAGVETRPFFLGMHEQPAFQERGLFRGEHYPVAERLARRGLYLPSGLGNTEEQFRRVSEALHKVTT
jgi:perosamine synthetase